MADFMPHLTKFFGQSPQVIAGPPNWRFRITTSQRLNQKLKVTLQVRVGFSGPLPPSTGLPDARTDRSFICLSGFQLFQTRMYRPTRNACRYYHNNNSTMPQNFGFSSKNQTSKTFIKRPFNKII